jgi:hypothetical protein
MNDVIENFHSVDFKYNSKKKSQTLRTFVVSLMIM